MAGLLGVFTFRRFIYFGFPVYLVIAEYAIRFLLSFVPGKVEDLAGVSTSSGITAAGLSLIATTLVPKPVQISAAEKDFLEARKARLVGNLDQNVISLAYLALLMVPFAWGWAMWTVHVQSVDYDLRVYHADLPAPLLVGVVVYFVGILFTEAKEVA